MPRTLCEWDKRDIERDLGKLARVIGEPRFVCRKCARSAEDPRYLCKPIRLPREASVGGSNGEAEAPLMSPKSLALAGVDQRFSALSS